MTERIYTVADLFCGAGGSSNGAKKAIEAQGGTMNLVAINHWNTAIATHTANHPSATHIIEDVNLVDPEAVVPDRRLDILMASPECKFYSRARGGKPVHDQGRMSPWAIHNWLTKIDVKNVLVENVPEFVDWGPLLPDDRPDKTKRGLNFQAWFLTFQALGYHAEWRMLNAADYGDATTRTRFFLLARKDENPITWPEPSHAKGDTGMFPGRLPWRGAREVIDWDNPGRSLLDHPKYIKKPLAEKTRQRIARGLERFGGPLAPLYIRLLDLPGERETTLTDAEEQPFILNRHGDNGSDRVHSVEEPVPTATTRGAGYLVGPDMEPFHGSDRQHTAPRSMGEPVHTVTTLTGGGLFTAKPEAKPFVGANRNNNAPKGMDEPVPALTTTTGGGCFLVDPGAKPFLLGQQSAAAPRSTDDPAPTIAAAGAISLIQTGKEPITGAKPTSDPPPGGPAEPYIVHYQGQSYAHDAKAPLSAITRCNKHALAQPTLIEFYGDIRNQDVGDPLTTITQRIKHGLINPVLIQYYSNGAATRVDWPVPTITTKDRHALANPTLIEVNHGDGARGRATEDHRVQSVDDPLPAITTKRGLGLAEPLLVQTSQTGGNGGYSRSTKDPLPTITTKNDINVVKPTAEPYIVPNFGERANQEPRVHDVNQPMPSVTGRGAGNLVSPTLDQPCPEDFIGAGIDPIRIVFLDHQPYILDIRFRMLQNEELARAMGFEDEESSYEFVGNVSEVTKQIGNAVPVHLAAALVGAALRDTTA